jgi:hypothetical protein
MPRPPAEPLEARAYCADTGTLEHSPECIARWASPPSPFAGVKVVRARYPGAAAELDGGRPTID